MLTDTQLIEALAKSVAPRITKEYIEQRIARKYFTVMNGNVTLCNIVLDNGYSVRGESACVNPANFNQEIGERIAYDNALDKLWPLFGFFMAESQYQINKSTN